MLLVLEVDIAYIEMSIETPETQTVSASASATSETISKSKVIATPTATPGTEESKEKDASQSIYSPANLLSSLLSPFSFSGTSETTMSSSEKAKDTAKSSTQISYEAPTSEISIQQTPEPCCTPEETPLFKTLAKTRLTRTRTKQLVRAGERAYNDPPPLGDCCGSSCDPCVRDLWKQEIGVWRERWGDWADEDGEKSKTEVKEKLGKRKELEW